MILGIMGVGGWGRNHAKVAAFLRADGFIDDVMVVDIIEERAKYFAKLYGHRYSTDPQYLIRSDEVGAVIVATPTKFHYEHGRALLEAGKHVLIEKPMTETPEQALELVDLASSRNLVLMTGFLLRYSPAVSYFIDNLKESFGIPERVYARRIIPHTLEETRRYAYGVTKDLAIHDLDLTQYIFGGKPRWVYARAKFYSGYDILNSIIVEYEFGGETFIGVYEAGWSSPEKSVTYEATNLDNKVSFDLVNHKLYFAGQTGIRIPRIPRSEPLYEEVKNFVLAAQKKDRPRVTGRDAYLAILLCDSAIKSAKEGRPIEIVMGT